MVEDQNGDKKGFSGLTGLSNPRDKPSAGTVGENTQPVKKRRPTFRLTDPSKLKEGDVVLGVVSNFTDYGAFINLGGIDGLLHITDMAWKRVRHPSEIVEVGQQIDVIVLKYDKDRNRVSLGLKQLGEDPWDNIARRYPVNSRVFGKVSNVTDFGAFVEIEPGVEGLVHVSDTDWANKNVNLANIVKVGGDIEALVLDVDEERRRISLGIKQLGQRVSVGGVSIDSRSESPAELSVPRRRPMFGFLKQLFEKPNKNPLGSKFNPVRCTGVMGEREYLERLRDLWGRGIVYERIGNFGKGPNGNIIDGFKVIDSQGSETQIFMDMYFRKHIETRAPEGFYIANWSVSTFTGVQGMEQDGEVLSKILGGRLDVSKCTEIVMYSILWVDKNRNATTDEFEEAITKSYELDAETANTVCKFISGK